MVKARDVLKRYVDFMGTNNYAELEAIVHPEYEGQYPQSRERIRGFAALKAQLEQYPGGLQAARAEPENVILLGDEERWVLTPGYTVLPLAGPDRYTAVLQTDYPDGTRWHIINIIELKDDLIYRTITYFAPEFERPEWRKDLTELM